MKTETHTSHAHQRQIVRQSLQDLLRDSAPRFHLTLSFSYSLSPAKSIEILNTLFYRLNDNLFRNQYRKGNRFLKGFAIMENTPGGMNNVHFHILIQNDETKRIEREQLLHLLNKHITKLNQQSRSTQQITQSHLQDYFDGNLERYLTKTFENKARSLDENLDRIGILSSDNILFGSSSNQDFY